MKNAELLFDSIRKTPPVLFYYNIKTLILKTGKTCYHIHMSRLRHNQQGLIFTIIIIGVIVLFGYITWRNFIRSDRGQDLQETTHQVIDTIEETTEGVTSEGGLIDTITQ